MITIVDYGMGNLGSVMNMFKRIKSKSVVTASLTDIEKAEKLLLPGVGAFDNAMRRINDSGIRKILDYKAKEQRIPVLGICLGMQLLTNSSEEGVLPGLGYIDAVTIRFQGESLKVPHMGWNEVTLPHRSRLTENLPTDPRFYFVHSFFVKVANEEDSIMKTNYGVKFDSGIQNDNIFGAQFHPEKSHKYGMKLLENFAKI